MATIIELNDAAISVWRDQKLLLSSPGFALLGAKQLVLGSTAFAGWRANPRLAVNQFWQKLSQDALPQAAPGARTFADLAYRHLEQLCADTGLGAQDEVMFAVPGTTSRDQLALLLGMAGQLGLQATALVDLAVAQAAAMDLPDTLWRGDGAGSDLVVLDVHLHRTLLSHLQCNADEPGSTLASLQAVQEVEGGDLALGQALVAAIADQFVKETRFDPLHGAASEQQLWQGLAGWLEPTPSGSPAQGAGTDSTSIRVELHSSSRSHHIELPADTLVQAAAGQCRNILTAMAQLPPGTPVLLTTAAARIPGLAAALASRPQSQVLMLQAGAGAAGILRHQELVRSTPESVQHVTRLPLALLPGTGNEGDARAAAPPQAAPQAAKPASTAAAPAAGNARPALGQADHLLLRDQAHAIGTRLVLGGSTGLALPHGDQVAQLVRRDGNLWLEPQGALRVNGDPVTSTLAVASGDRIEAGGALLILIQVLPAD